MATTAETAASPSPYEGGVGGKFLSSRRSQRGRPSTPYDRPRTAFRNPSGPNSNNNGRDGWISKLVDPASRIITASAARLFSTVFRKRLTAPPSEPDPNPEVRHGLPKENPSAGVAEQRSKDGENVSNSHGTYGIDELEQLLQKKTFTRVEFDHLTELLRSRTIDFSVDVENTIEPSTSQLVGIHNGQEKAGIPGQENKEGSRFLGSMSTTNVGLRVGKEVPAEASPTELAKAYMGSRPSKVSPSALGMRSRTFRQDPSSLNCVTIAAKSPSMSFTPRSASRYSGVPGSLETCYMTPRPRVRSALYSMSRTPYSGVRSSANLKCIEPANGGYVGPSTLSDWTLPNNTVSGVKQVLKRSSAVMDNDFGSGGPIRRIRQKYNMVSPPKENLRISSLQKPLLLDGQIYNMSNPLSTANGDNQVSNATVSSVPPQSSEMARKILQQLDKLVPSPKDKSSEPKLAMAGEKSPTKLTPNMLNGRALRSMEEIESPMLQNLPGNHNLDQLSGLNATKLPTSSNSVTEKQDGTRENGPLKVAAVGVKLAPEVEPVKHAVFHVKNHVTGAKPVDSVDFGFDANVAQVRRAFQMCAPEDYVDLDDDSCSGKDASVTKPAEEEKSQSSVAGHKVIIAETVTAAKPLISTAESKPVAGVTLSNGVAVTAGASNGPVPNVKGASPTLPPAATTESVTLSPPSPIPSALSPSLFNGALPLKHETTTLFSFGSKIVDEDPTTCNFSNASGVANSETLSSNPTAVATPPEAGGSDGGNKNKDENLHKSLQNPVLSGISTVATSTIFSFGASTNSSLSNGSLPSTTLLNAASSAPNFSNSLIPISTSSSTPATSSSKTPPVSAASPTLPTGPIFKFGSGTTAAVAPSNLTPQVSTNSVLGSADAEPKAKQASLSNITGSPLSTLSSPAFSATGNSIFGFNASTSAGTMNLSSASSQSQNPAPFGTDGAGSLFGSTQATPGASSMTPFTQGAINQFGLSSSSPAFGSSGSAFSFGGSQFGVSATGSKPFGSASVSGLSSSAASSTVTGSFSSSSGSFAPSGAASGLSVASSQSATSSIFGSGFVSTSLSQATGFSFGASAPAAATVVGSTPLPFGSSFGASSASTFSFTSSAPAAGTSTSTFAPSQSLFGASSPVIGFGSTSPGNDQMNEDSMAEDVAQASSVPMASPVFGQPVANSAAQSNFSFGSPAIVPSGGVFQFGSHQNPTAQAPSPFLATGNLPGGSFSLGAGGSDKADKSTRRIIRAKRDKPRKK